MFIKELVALEQRTDDSCDLR